MKSVAQAYTGETIVIDGQKFVDCEFRQCVLIYRGGELPLFDGSFLDNCDWRFEEAALRTIHLLQRLNSNGGRQLVETLFTTPRS